MVFCRKFPPICSKAGVFVEVNNFSNAKSAKVKSKARNVSSQIDLAKGRLPIKNPYCPEKLPLTLFCKISHFVRNDNQVVINGDWVWFAAKP